MPSNANYLTAAYIVTAVILLAFAITLWRNSNK
jgi:hypothetical protein